MTQLPIAPGPSWKDFGWGRWNRTQHQRPVCTPRAHRSSKAQPQTPDPISPCQLVPSQGSQEQHLASVPQL